MTKLELKKLIKEVINEVEDPTKGMHIIFSSEKNKHQMDLDDVIGITFGIDDEPFITPGKDYIRFKKNGIPYKILSTEEGMVIEKNGKEVEVYKSEDEFFEIWSNSDRSKWKADDPEEDYEDESLKLDKLPKELRDVNGLIWDYYLFKNLGKPSAEKINNWVLKNGKAWKEQNKSEIAKFNKIKQEQRNTGNFSLIGKTSFNFKNFPMDLK